MTKILGEAFAECFATGEGLRSIHLPEGLDQKLSRTIVRHANLLRSGGPETAPFAVLVWSGEEDTSDPLCHVVSTANAIQYRLNDRLAVIDGRFAELKSFSQAFTQLVGPDFPSGASGSIVMRPLSACALARIVEVAGVQPVPVVNDAAVERLANCLQQIADSYVALKQGATPWNLRWFEHVARGLDGLAERLTRAVNENEDIDLEEFLQRYTFAAFALPVPNNGQFLASLETAGKLIAEAIDSWWGDSQRIGESVIRLAGHPDTEGASHPLAGIDWTEHGRTMAVEDNSLLAFMVHSSLCADAIDRFAQLTEPQFFDPYSKAAVDASLRIFDENDRSLSLSGDGSPYLIALHYTDVPDERCSQRVVLNLPLLDADLDESEVAALARGSGPIVRPLAPNVIWTGSLEVRDGAVCMVGEFTFAPEDRIGINAIELVGIEVALPDGDPLTATVAAPATASVIFLPPDGVTLLAFAEKKGVPQLRGQVRLSGFEPDPAALPEDMHQSIDVEGLGDYRVFIWNAEQPTRDSEPIQAWGGQDRAWSTAFKLTSSTTFDVEGTSIELYAEEQRANVLSPLLAAATGTAIDRSEVELSVRDSLRGRLEQTIASWVENDTFARALGHIAIGTSDDMGFDDLRPIRNGEFLGSEAIEAVWPREFDVNVPVDFIDCDAVADFRLAFQALNAVQQMTVQVGPSDEVTWPSRTSWRPLWQERDTLARYLGAYAAMVEAAVSHGSPSAIFWASYPFSVSLWAQGSGTPSAVLLSPLHPLRLSWLASAEHTLAEASESGGPSVAVALGGSIEGWNLPLIGHRGSGSGRMIAVPIDSGPAQLFVGWSMLTSVSVGDPEVLAVPQSFAGMAGPGSSSSGLNAASTDSALRDYRRVNPHVSTLTVDLASAVPTSRMEEVDQAVLAALEAWSSPTRAAHSAKQPTGIGGFRVLDSLNRTGVLPRGEVADLLQRCQGVPITWTRYEPTIDATQRCNLRLLQDSGIKVAVEAQGDSSLGVLGEVPLRRFEGGGSTVAHQSSKSRPAVPQGVGWEPFSAALRQIEFAAQNPRLETRLLNSLLVDERADWTVSGETHMSPAAMAQLLAASGPSTQMLWEWRPPMLENSKRATHIEPLLLERRPFVSVVRVPMAFKSRLKGAIGAIRGTVATDNDVESVLSVLGARGVGLSSLIAMGGTHVAGALGFYLSLRLLDTAIPLDGDFLVMPIDACESFLRALGDPTIKRADRRKADLLAIALTDEAVVMVPIEVKFYGLLAQGVPQTLPDIQSSVLDKSVSQLNSTMDLLRSVEDESRTAAANRASGRSRLWSNSLAAFLDSAIRLRNKPASDPSLTARRLQAVVDGRLPVAVGRPVITFYGHGSMTADGASGRAHRVEGSSGRSDISEVGALIVNPGALWSELDAESGDLLDGWSRIMGWAVERVPDTLAERRRTPTVPDQPDELPDSPSADSELKPVLRPSEPPVPDVAEPTPPRELEVNDVATANCSGGVRFDVGNFLGSVGGTSADYWPGNTALTQMNIGVVGDLGTGKTQLLKSIIYQLRKTAEQCQPNPLSFLIFDYKRDYQDEAFCAAVGGTVIPPFNIPLNVFALAEPYSGHAAFQKAQSFIDVLSKIYSGIGPVQRNNLAQAIIGLFQERGGTPPTVKQVLNRYQQTVGAPDAVVSILNGFVMGEIFSDEPDALVPFESLIGDKVAILALDKLGVDDKMKNALVVLFLNFYNDYMLHLRKWDFEIQDGVTVRRLNSFLLVDEALNIMKYEFPVLERLLLQGREFGLGVILASQFLTHFKQGQTNYAEPLLTWFIHRIPAVTKNQLQNLGMQGALEDLASRVPALGVHQAIYRSLGCSGRLIRGTPFFELLRS